MNKVFDILTDIAQREAKRLMHSKELTVGLLSGDMGSIVFLYEYSQIDKSFLAIADEMLERLLKSLRQRHHISTYCSGIAGMAVGLHELHRKGYIDLDFHALTDFDRYIAAMQSFMLSNNQHDFLHGFIGLGFYWAMRLRQGENSISTVQLARLVDYLARTSEFDRGAARWLLPPGKLTKPYNISISHGCSSTIILLCDLLELPQMQEHHPIIRRLAGGGADYLLRNQISPEQYGCWFASTSLDCERAHRGRLAWCYGDLGVCVALARAGQVLADSSLTALSKQVLEYSASHRRGIAENQVRDACVCHGAAGVGVVFREMAEHFGSPVLADAASYWRDVVCQMAVYECDGVTFPYYDAVSHRLAHRTAILEGDVGVAMFLIGENRPSSLGTFLLINR